KREREERAAGKGSRAAIEAAAATSGRSILISGFTVMIAMAGMLLSGDKTYLGFGIATIIVVGIAMLGSLTVLPALLSRLGDKVERGRIPFFGRLRRSSGENRFWKSILTPALRHPAIAATAAATVLVAMALPVLHLHTAQSGMDALPDSAQYAVTGPTAASADENALLKSKAPIVFGFVLVFAFLLLLVTFRSLVIAAKAVVLNLLSVGAAYGVLVAVFQWGWGANLLGFTSNGGIAQWLPIFMFVILFGLSMDYHVFILSRVREAYDRGMKTEDAVAHGILTTAGVVTSAALVMVGAFAVFALMPILDMKEMGIGLAVAVLLDAMIVLAV